MMQATLIEKEEIQNLHFKNSEVLKDAEAIAERRHDLENAMLMGNTDHNKVKIVFECTDGIFFVETTVWSVTQHSLMLKGNTLIPIHAIHQISFFE
jgi:hypothetical protein